VEKWFWKDGMVAGRREMGNTREGKAAKPPDCAGGLAGRDAG